MKCCLPAAMTGQKWSSSSRGTQTWAPESRVTHVNLENNKQSGKRMNWTLPWPKLSHWCATPRSRCSSRCSRWQRPTCRRGRGRSNDGYGGQHNIPQTYNDVLSWEHTPHRRNNARHVEAGQPRRTHKSPTSGEWWLEESHVRCLYPLTRGPRSCLRCSAARRRPRPSWCTQPQTTETPLAAPGASRIQTSRESSDWRRRRRQCRIPDEAASGICVAGTNPCWSIPL